VFAADGSDERFFIQDYSMEQRLAALFSPAVVDAPLVAMPVELEAGRLSGNQQQVMHEGCFSIAHFLDRSSATFSAQLPDASTICG
jgi:hypothetical protein